MHSDWGEIRNYHLIGKNNTMCAKVEYYKPHYREIIPLGSIQVDATIEYIKWLKEEFKSNELSPYMELLFDFKRVINIINSYILNEYINDPKKYLYE